jgi:hypothetical protein
LKTKTYCHVIYFLFCIGCFLNADAQPSVSVSTGISKDINNSISFFQIPFSVIWHPSGNKKAPVIFELDYLLPLGNKSSGNAYTLNPSMPEKIVLKEKISPFVFTASFGFRIHLLTTKENNAFYLNIVPVGVCWQKINVSYEKYDHSNYEIMNPDVDSKVGGVVMSMAPVYYFHKTKQDIMLMLHLQTPLLKGKRDYQLSYKYVAPLQLTFGYNFYYNK